MVGQPTASGKFCKSNAELVSAIQELKARLAALEARTNPNQRRNTFEFLSGGLDEAFERNSDGIAFFDTDDQLVLCNMLGFSQEELQSINLRTLIPPEDWVLVEELHSLLETGEIGNAVVEDQLIRKDGSRIWRATSHAPDLP
jgi:PAS domain S-box-containing protein